MIRDDIVKSQIDKRSYRHIRLDNGLDCLLISDPETDKSSACCNVNVGCMADPKHAQGLAHFLEHMLFMGTESYPVENAYSAFLNNHGGYSNAYTAEENTVYYFDVQNNFFEEALDMFAAFFTCPLFTDSATNREMNAVDSENTKNLQSDVWRKAQLIRSLAREDHALNTFGTGNLTTLTDGPNSVGQLPRDVMIDFYNKYYSANLMKAVVYGKEDLDTLQKWAVPRFSKVPNKNFPVPSYPSDPYPASHVMRALEIVPIKDTRSLDIFFPIPSVFHLYLTKPTSYLSHLVGHESEGSILSVLKRKTWANSLSCYHYESLRDAAIFALSIDLTEEGVLHYEEIMSCVFAYLGMIERSGAQEWIWQEQQETDAMNFRFVNKSDPADYAVDLSNNMHQYPVEHIITGSALKFSCDLPATMDFLKHLKPENCITFLWQRAFAGKTELKEKWYGTEHNNKAFDAAWLQKWNAYRFHAEKAAVYDAETKWLQAVKLPMKNPFIPTNFDLVNRDLALDADRVPKLLQKLSSNAFPKDAPSEDEGLAISHSTQLQAWYMPDLLWNVPKANVMLTMESSFSTMSPLSVALTDVFASCLKEILNEYSYYADCAGLEYKVRLSKGGLELVYKGYNHKLPLLIEKTFEEMANMTAVAPDSAENGLTNALFDRIKESELRNYKNFLFWQPYQHSMNSTSLCLEEPRWSQREKYNALMHATIQDLTSYIAYFLRTVHLEVLVHGNFSEAETSAMTARLLSQIRCAPLPVSQVAKKRIVDLSGGTEYVYRQSSEEHNPAELNSAIENTYFIGMHEFNDQKTALIWEAFFSLLEQLMSEAAFDQLRTKEQLGYIAFTGVKRISNICGLHIIVQSSHKDADYLNGRIEEFLRSYLSSILAPMTEEVFQSYKDAVIEKLLEKPKNINEETGRYWEEVKNNTYIFDRKKQLVEVLRGGLLTASYVKNAYQLNFLDDHLGMAKFSARFFGKDKPIPAAPSAETKPEAGSVAYGTVVIVEEPSLFKATMPLLPLK